MTSTNQLYVYRFEAVLEIRDPDGTLVEARPVQGEQTIDHETAIELGLVEGEQS